MNDFFSAFALEVFSGAQHSDKVLAETTDPSSVTVPQTEAEPATVKEEELLRWRIRMCFSDVGQVRRRFSFFVCCFLVRKLNGFFL